jgi:FMN phosphatase YigB (HAD superfamily)
MSEPKIVTLFDVDDTLLDHDRVTADLRRHLHKFVGPDRARRYWELFEEIRTELGYADYLGALQRYRLEHPRDPHLLEVSYYLMSYPFANRLYPGSIDAVEHARTWGPAAILSDGDVVFQPLKISRSGLYEVFDGNVLIYVHKEHELDDVEERYPAEHYIMVDDKLRILEAIKKQWRDRVTTVFVRQGHYALDPQVKDYAPADLTLERIGEFPNYSHAHLVAAGTGAQRPRGSADRATP